MISQCKRNVRCTKNVNINDRKRLISDNKYKKHKVFIRNCMEIVFCAIFVYRKMGCVYGTMNANKKSGCIQRVMKEEKNERRR